MTVILGLPLLPGWNHLSNFEDFMSKASRSILIVDDAPGIVERIDRLLLTISGVSDIRHASRFGQALISLGQARPDIVLLDINLPDGNGIELLRHIKGTDPSIVVIMLTNQSGELYRMRTKALGADQFLDKSIDFHRIPEVLSHYL